MIKISDFFENNRNILGINDRNVSFEYLNAGKRRIADDKLLTKKILKKANLPTPELFAVIKTKKDIENFDFETLPDSFVLKPSKGLKGAGINIYYRRDKRGRWSLSDGRKHSVSDIKSHIYNILDGQFSLGIKPEPCAAFFEERVVMHKSFSRYSRRGIPDIRVIVYNNVPTMAMLRLPTDESDGKANISLGGIGVGIDMTRGVTTHAIKNGLSIETIPNKNLRISGIKIPYWNKILLMAAKCQEITGLGYLGVDIIIDREKGPMIVELNSRPGLGIQAANQAGLKERLQRVRKLKLVTPERGVRIAKDLFGGEIDEEIESISGREIIGLSEEVLVFSKNRKKITVQAKIDTGADSSSIDKNLAIELGFADAIKYFESVKRKYHGKNINRMYANGELSHEKIVQINAISSANGKEFRIKVKIPAKINDKEFIISANIANRSNLKFPMILGRKDLSNFLIDPTR